MSSSRIRWFLFVSVSSLVALLVIQQWPLTPSTSDQSLGCGKGVVSVQVEPHVLKASGDDVKVLWPCISRSPGDWVGIFDGATGSHMFTRHDLSLVDTSHVYKLINLRRGGYSFRFFRSNGEVVAQSETVSFGMGDGEPTQLHTALTGDSKSVRIMWVTDKPDEPIVLVDDESPTLRSVEHLGTSTTYKATDMCETTRLWQEPGWIHDVLVKDLVPGRTYHFRYGNKKSDASDRVVWAPTLSSVTLPPSQGQASSFDALFVGDMGNGLAYCQECIPDLMDDAEYQAEAGAFAPGATAVVSAMNRSIDGVAFVAHIGDLSYALGVEMKWDYWMHTIEPVASRVPYMISVGNHEYGYDHGADKDPSGAPRSYASPGHEDVYGDSSLGECGVPTARRFHMPGNGNGVFWYSMEAGLAHFTFLSLEHNISDGSPQHAWLLSDLSKVDRTRTPWLIVSSHRPLYCGEISASGDYTNGLYLATLLDDIFKRYDVNLYFAGHYHAYERTCPIYKGKCMSSASAPTHITVGTGGIDVDLGTWDAPWSVVHFDPAFGYGRLSVLNASALRWQYVNVTLEGREDLLDEFWLHRPGSVMSV